MTPRIALLLVVTFLSACGTRALALQASGTAREPAALESRTDDDYVVGPFVTSSKDGQAGVRTYYIVRN
jgi:hypothetical protein